MCHIANSVLAGGIRRSAMISLFSHDDEEMITCKYGNWWDLETSPTMRVWVRLNQSVTMIALFVAIGGFSVAYLKFNEDRMKADEDRISKAWDTVTKMAGKGSNGGQIHAIEILVKNGVSLDSADLRNTYLAGANLKGLHALSQPWWGKPLWRKFTRRKSLVQI